MIKNNLKIAWRTLKKQPFFTFLNTFGLAVGMAGGLLIGLYIYDELSFDNMFADADRIYRVNVDLKFGDWEEGFASSPAVLGPTLKKDFDEVELMTRFRGTGSLLVKRPNAEDNLKVENTAFVDTSFLQMFGFKLLQGRPEACLSEPGTLLITESLAKDIFGSEDVVGKSVMLENRDILRITGVVQDMPQKSFLRNFGIFMSMASFDAAEDPIWGNYNFPTFIKLNDKVSQADFAPKLQSIFDNYNLPNAQKGDPTVTKASFEKSGNYIKYSLIAIEDLHLSTNRVSELSPNGDMQSIYILGAIAIFLILLACVNFMNLSTAQSLKRAKEVGVRKTLGSDKLGLVTQFLTESGLITFLSLGLALLVAVVALPYFNELADKNISLPLLNPFFWLILLAATFILGLFSGSYPAFFLSGFTPVKVLKGSNQNLGGGKIRNSLVVFQFAISIFLIISTLVVFQQLNYIQNKNLGYQKEQILIIDDVYAAGTSVESFKEQITNLNLVESATLSSYLPTPSNRSDSGFELKGTNEEDKVIQMQNWRVDHDYAKTLNLEMMAGRFFDKSFSTDTSGIILNETAVSVLGLNPAGAIGKKLERLGADSPEYSTIIGVVKNFHYQSLKDDIGALSMHIGSRAGKLTVKLSPGDFKSTIAEIEEKWQAVAPGQPFNHYFMDDSFNNTYESEQRLGSIFFTFTILSLLIACLGLFGLAAFNAEKRTKEIGVRKVMGASVGQISYRLTIDFLKLVGVAILIALPLGWFIMNKWLEDFSYRIDIPIWIYILAAVSAILISILTVSYQSIKAAVVNPVKSLKSE